MPMKTRQLNVVAIFAILIGSALGLRDGKAQDDYDFHTDILPVLKQRCFSCHSGENREGDLWLDSKNSMLSGGHTGSRILGDVEESELIARIESTEEGYRMPKDGPPLTVEQQKAFRNWVADRAPWPQLKAASQGESAKPPKSFAEKSGDLWLTLATAYESPSWKYASWIVIPAIVVIFFFLLNRILYRRRQRRKGEPEQRPFIRGWVSFFAWPLFIALTACCAFLWGRVEENESEISQLKKLGPKLELTKTFGASFDKPPKVARPLHPKRLGGTYYRGNDERSSQLFNDGFYRTANMEVLLVDGDGNTVDYDTHADRDSLAIEYRFQRAKGATTKLFSKRVLKTGFMSSSWGGTAKSTDKVLFRRIDDDNWAVTFPLNLSDDGPQSGDLFIYYGPFERNRIHYQIRYDLRFEPDGTLNKESEIWMGSAYNLSGRVITGNEGQILLDRWFDFRPIPEIEGKNADSPELLGLPEHLE